MVIGVPIGAPYAIDRESANGKYFTEGRKGNEELTEKICPVLRFQSCYFSAMGLDATARRRWFGAGSLSAAVVMLIVGETVLKGHLVDLGFIVYWLICFGFTGLAILSAFLDARAARRRIRDEHRKLLETTLEKIEVEGTGSPPEIGGNTRP